ncbi:MAG TPA: tetratricopeptide repeat protein [Gammaproteobacteria bacterium]|nr:tetratricopeptide repeat protein [Gammaproteobacteria bacterium]
MTEYLTEQEQIQQLKNWIKQYGFTILAGIIIALAMTTGWRYWQNYRDRILSHASIVYDEMLNLRAQNNMDGASVQAKKLLKHYPRTPYAQMAALMLAREAVLRNNYIEAKNQLQWILDHSKDNSLREIARIRLARLLLAEKNPEEALNLLKKWDNKNFIGLVDEVRGDAYLEKNDMKSARQAYQLALAEIPNAVINRPVLQMKYDNLT